MKHKFLAVLGLSLISTLALSQPAHAGSITITDTSDSAAIDTCTLRDAINLANASGPTGNCVVAGGGTLDTINLQAATYQVNTQLDVFSNITVKGAGSGSTTVTPNGASTRVFEIETNGGTPVTVIFQGFTITDGNVDGSGGGIYIDPENTLTLEDVHVNGNIAEGSGGGIFNNGLLTVSNSQVNGNTANDGDGGGIFNSFVPVKPLKFGKLLQAIDQGTTIVNSTVSGNHADVDLGGGIYNESDLVIDRSTLDGNTTLQGGGIYIVDIGQVVITNSTISNNTASDDDGAGVFLEADAVLSMTNSTLSGNTANGNGGGILFETICGNSSGAREFFNVTVSNNTATKGEGGGVAVIDQCAGIKLGVPQVSLPTFFNSIIAGNINDSGVPDCSGSFTSGSYNLIGNSTGCTGFDTTTNGLLDVAPNLGTLQNNGGPTFTHALLTGSPAIDSANPSGCVNEIDATMTQDQRGFARPINATGLPTAICDRGAFEVGNSDITVTKVDDTGGVTETGTPFNYIITVTSNGPSPALNTTLSDPVPSQMLVTGNPTTTAGTCTHTGNQVDCQLGDIAVDQTVTITVPVVAVSNGEGIVNTVTVQTTTDGQTIAQTKQASTATSVGGLELFGDGCSLHPGSQGHPMSWLMGLAFVAGLSVALRVRRVSR